MENIKSKKIDADKLRDVRRFCNVCNRLAETAQIAASLPNTYDVADQAERDNYLIDSTLDLINGYEDAIIQNSKISPHNQRKNGLTNNQLGMRIDEQGLILVQLKIGDKTADDIVRENLTRNSRVL